MFSPCMRSIGHNETGSNQMCFHAVSCFSNWNIEHVPLVPSGLPWGVLPPVRALPGGDDAPGGSSAAARSGLLLPEQRAQTHHREDAAGAVHRPEPELRREVHANIQQSMCSKMREQIMYWLHLGRELTTWKKMYRKPSNQGEKPLVDV